MKRYRSVVIFCLWSLATQALSQAPLLTATETVLPRYQSLSLDRDIPATDLLLDDSTLYVAGKHSVWKWDLKNKTLRRVRLLNNSSASTLSSLTTDGISLMTASDHHVFRIQKSPLKVLKYKHPLTNSGQSIGLTGQDDQMFWIHTKGVLHIDRYGKTLVPRFKNTGLDPSSKVALDATRQTLWIANADKLFQANVGKHPTPPKLVFDAKKTIKDIQLVGSQLMLHTDQAVLRFDQNGKRIDTIPVTGDRRLVTMEISKNQHAYLFSDGLLEIFHMPSQTSMRYLLPLENPKQAKVSVNKMTVAVIDDGIPRVFSLSQPLK